MIYDWILKSSDSRLQAILSDDAANLAPFLDANPYAINERFLLGQTLLHIAVQVGARKSALLLLDNGADLEAHDQSGNSPLMCAVEHEQIELARLLLGRGALLTYVHQPPNDPATQEASKSEFEKTFRGLEPEFSTLMKKVEAEIPQELGEAGVESLENLIPFNPAEMANMIATFAFRPQTIHAIHFCQNLESLKMLIEEFASPVNVISGEGEWPLKSFARQGDAAAVAYLLQYGADPHLTSTGATALHDAVAGGNPECVRLLLNAGANSNQQDVDMCVPLSDVQNAESLDLLLAAGADVNVTDQSGLYPSSWIKEPILKAKVKALEKLNSGPASLSEMDTAPEADDEMPFTRGQGDLGKYLIEQALKCGAEAVSIDNLPSLKGDWRFFEDQYGVVVHLEPDRFEEVQRFLMDSFGPPAHAPSETSDGGKLGWYAAKVTGISLQFGFNSRRTQVTILRPQNASLIYQRAVSLSTTAAEKKFYNELAVQVKAWEQDHPRE